MTRAKGKRQARRSDDEWDALTLRLIEWTDNKLILCVCGEIHNAGRCRGGK